MLKITDKTNLRYKTLMNCVARATRGMQESYVVKVLESDRLGNSEKYPYLKLVSVYENALLSD